MMEPGDRHERQWCRRGDGFHEYINVIVRVDQPQKRRVGAELNKARATADRLFICSWGAAPQKAIGTIVRQIEDNTR